jgi:hypothetical protein
VLRRLLWSSVYGRYGTGMRSETGLDDAFITLMDVLALRRAQNLSSSTSPVKARRHQSVCAPDPRVQAAVEAKRSERGPQSFLLCQRFCSDHTPCTPPAQQSGPLALR